MLKIVPSKDILKNEHHLEKFSVLIANKPDTFNSIAHESKTEMEIDIPHDQMGKKMNVFASVAIKEAMLQNTAEQTGKKLTEDYHQNKPLLKEQRRNVSKLPGFVGTEKRTALVLKGIIEGSRVLFVLGIGASICLISKDK